MVEIWHNISEAISSQCKEVSEENAQLGCVETTNTHFTHRRVVWRALRIWCSDLERKLRLGWMTCSNWIQEKGTATSNGQEMRTAVAYEMNSYSTAVSEDGPRAANAVVLGRQPRSSGILANWVQSWQTWHQYTQKLRILRLLGRWMAIPRLCLEKYLVIVGRIVWMEKPINKSLWSTDFNCESNAIIGKRLLTLTIQ